MNNAKFSERLRKLAGFGRVCLAADGLDDPRTERWTVELERDGVVAACAVDVSVNTAMHRVLERAEQGQLTDCPTGKFKIPTEGEAEEAATSLTRKNLRQPRAHGRTAARAYQCPQCQAWHLTSQAPRGGP